MGLPGLMPVVSMVSITPISLRDLATHVPISLTTKINSFFSGPKT